MNDIAPPFAAVPEPVRRRSDFTRAVVEAATSRRLETRWQSAVQCIGRRGRKKCDGLVEVERRPDAVEWACGACGDSGVVTRYADSESDLSRYAPQGKTVLWGYDDEERTVLSEATTHLPELRAVVARCRIERKFPGVFLVEATVTELDSSAVVPLRDLDSGEYL